MHDAKTNPVLMRKIMFLRYRERMGLSYAEALKEPAEEIERAMLVWSLDAQRAKVKSASSS